MMHPKRENLWKDKTNTGALIRDPGPFHALQLWEFPRIPYVGIPVSEKNSSRKLADQARLPTPRYRIGAAGV